MLFSRTLTRGLVYCCTVFVFVLCITSIVQKEELELIRQFQALREVNPLPKAQQLAASGDYCEAMEYLEYFMEYDYVKQDAEIGAFYGELRRKRQSYAFIGTDIASGVLTGKGACPESLVSATVSDFLIIGDIRDLIKGALNTFYYGEHADEFTMALAGVGIVASGITYASAGAASPAKVSVSLLKTAQKLGKLPKSLERSLTKLFKESVQAKDIQMITPVTDAVYNISRVNGMKMQDFFTILSRSGSVKDLRVMETVAAAYGNKTGKFLKLGGDTPVEVLKRFPKDPFAAIAVDSAVRYGREGGKLLEKTGPARFLKYVTYTKYAARTTRTLWEKRLTSFLLKFMSLFPVSAIILGAVASGLVVVGMPARYVWDRRRRRASKSVAGKTD